MAGQDEFDCPEGTCGEDEPRCRDIELGDEIDPNSVAHLERNECNRCPASPPTPVTVRKRRWVGLLLAPGGWEEYDEVVGYIDCEGNEWAPDNRFTSWHFHGDPNPLTTDFDRMNATFRVVPSGSVRGWQCRYVNGGLDDTSPDMGTYDYAPAGISEVIEGILPGGERNEHDDMDVQPHNANGNYVPGLTTVYCR